MQAIKLKKDSIAVEQKNYATKIVNAYIVYDFDDWPKIPRSNSKFETFLFGPANIVKTSDKERWAYSGYGIAFDGTGS